MREAELTVQGAPHSNQSNIPPQKTGYAGVKEVVGTDRYETNRPLDSDRFLHVRVIETGFKYSLVRIEEEYEAGTQVQDTLLSRKEMVADHMIVKLKSGTDRQVLEALNRKYGAVIRKKMGAPDSYLVSFACESADSLDRMLQAYNQELADIAYAEPDYLVHTQDTIPNDTLFSSLWGMHNTGQVEGVVDADIDAPQAWAFSTGSSAVLVGLIDSGIDYTHGDLASNIWVNPGEAGLLARNGIDDDGNGYIDDWHGWDFVNDDNDPMDDQYHGTHCAGTIGAVGNNSMGVAGVCWRVSMVGLKFLDASGSGFTSDAVDALYYATGIRVDLTSNSWGGGGYSISLRNAIEDAAAHDMLFVAAAGNDGTNTDVGAHYPSSYDCSNIIAVAATDRHDALADFSNYGASTVDIAAPGDDIYSTSPGNTYRSLSGTSMATPHVAGACALIKSVNGSLSAARIKEMIMESADPLPALNGFCVSGGRLNLYRTLINIPDSLVVVNEFSRTDVNGDGYLNPGESVTLFACIKNIGMVLASNATLTVSVDCNGVTVTPVRRVLGTLAGNTVLPGRFSFTLSAGSAIVTPQPFHIEFTVSDASGRATTSHYENAVYRTGSVSGLVQRARDGTPLGAAQVNYEGTISGCVTTDANGRFFFSLVDGEYNVWAEKSGFAASASRRITMPDAVNLVLDMGRPELRINPEVIQVSVPKGGAVSADTELSNIGDGPMNYSLHDDGYTVYHSSNQYNWIDISSTGTEVTGLNDDLASDIINIGFDFPFYGVPYNTLRICANGLLTFGAASYTTWLNGELPRNAYPWVPMAALFWDDLDLRSSGRVFYRLLEDKFIVQYEAVPFYRASNLCITCEAILYRNGQIDFQYKRTDLTDSCTVGLDGGTGSNGVTVIYNQTGLFSGGQIIRFNENGASWLTLPAGSGEVAAGESLMLACPLNASELMAGTTYTASVEVVNEGFGETADVEIRLSVLGTSGNHAPVKGEDLTFTIKEDESIPFTLPVSDPDNDPLYVTIQTPCSNGTVQSTGDYSYRYQPVTNFNGEDEIIYTVSDLEATLTGRVHFVIQEVNDPTAILLRYPRSGAVYCTGTVIKFEMNVSDPDSLISDVSVLLDGQGSQTAAHYTNDVYQCFWPPLSKGAQFYRVKVTDDSGVCVTSALRYFSVQSVRSADEAPETPVMGLTYSYYEGRGWTNLPDYSSMTPIRWGRVGKLTTGTVATRENDYGLSYEGYFHAPTSGVYEFDLTSDDGSCLYIGDNAVVTNDGCHSSRSRSGKIGLGTGYHRLRVDYFNVDDPSTLYMNCWRLDPEGSYLLQTNNLFRELTAFTNAVANMATPLENACFRAGENTTFVIEAYDGDAELDRVCLNEEGKWQADAVQTTNQDLYAFTWTNLPAGRHAIAACTVDENGAVATGTVRHIDVYEGVADSWTSCDIGNVGIAGWVGYNPTTEKFRFETAGSDIGGVADSFHYVYQAVSGDAEIVTRLEAMDLTHEWGKAGIMIRESTDVSSRHALILLSPEHGIGVEARLQTGGESTTQCQAGITFPCWLKMTRGGELIQGSYSLDGTQWFPYWSGTFSNLPETVLFGMAVCSHRADTLCRAVFSDVIVGELAAIRISAWPSSLYECENAKSVLRISRQGYAITGDLPVRLTFSGSAQDGEDYQTMESETIIPDGKEAVELEFRLIADEKTEGDEEAVITVQVDSPYRTGVPSVARIHIAETPDRAWQLRYFTTNEIDQTLISQDNSDPDCDGINNFEEYVYGSNPRTCDGDLPKLIMGREATSNGLPSVCIRYRLYTDDILYQLEISDDLVNWKAAAGKPVAVESSTSNDDPDMQLLRLEVQPDEEWNRTYIRLHVRRGSGE